MGQAETASLILCYSGALARATTMDKGMINKPFQSYLHPFKIRSPRVLGFVTVAVLLWLPAAMSAPLTPALWQVAHGKGHSYLFGSIHMGRDSWYPLPKIVEDAYEHSERLVVEVDVRDGQQIEQILQQTALLPRTEHLQQHLSEATWQALQQYSQRLGIDDRGFSRMRPWMVYLTLATVPLSQLGLTQEAGVDRYFINRLQQRQLIPLESPESQLALFSSLSLPLQEQLLTLLLKTPSEEAAQLVNGWRSGNTEIIRRLLTRQSQASAGARWFEEALLIKRNQQMAERIIKLLQGSTQHFVVVGLAHLVGDKSIISQLRQQGFIVSRVDY